MRKKMTLTDKAQRLAKTQVSEMAHPHTAFMVGYLAGHRANRLTRAERAVVKAAQKWRAQSNIEVAHHYMRALSDAIGALERAKGGAR